MMSTSVVMALRLLSPVVILCLVLKAYAQDGCDRPDIIVPRHVASVCVGHPFNLSCRFICLSPSHRRLLLLDNKLLRNESATDSNSTLYYSLTTASSEDNGTYVCKIEPTLAVGPSMSIHINDTCVDKQNDKEGEGETVRKESYLLVICYLLCKAGAFFFFITITLLPNCHVC